jgi:Na+-driven multidrug efflux pump
VVSWYTIFSYLGSVRNIWILAENKQKYLWILNTTGALANVVLNFAFIPMWGIVGAAIASLVTQFVTNVIMSLIIKPLRRNNLIMLKGLNPKLLFNMVKTKKI